MPGLPRRAHRLSRRSRIAPMSNILMLGEMCRQRRGPGADDDGNGKSNLRLGEHVVFPLAVVRLRAPDRERRHLIPWLAQKLASHARMGSGRPTAGRLRHTTCRIGSLVL